MAPDTHRNMEVCNIGYRKSYSLLTATSLLYNTLLGGDRYDYKNICADDRMYEDLAPNARVWKVLLRYALLLPLTDIHSYLI